MIEFYFKKELTYYFMSLSKKKSIIAIEISYICSVHNENFITVKYFQKLFMKFYLDDLRNTDWGLRMLKFHISSDAFYGKINTYDWLDLTHR